MLIRCVHVGHTCISTCIGCAQSPICRLVPCLHEANTWGVPVFMKGASTCAQGIRHVAYLQERNLLITRHVPDVQLLALNGKPSPLSLQLSGLHAVIGVDCVMCGIGHTKRCQQVLKKPWQACSPPRKACTHVARQSATVLGRVPPYRCQLSPHAAVHPLPSGRKCLAGWLC